MNKYLFKITTTTDETLVGVVTCDEEDLEYMLSRVAIKSGVEPETFEAQPVENETVWIKI